MDCEEKDIGMRRSLKTKAVYQELRKSLGETLSPKQALEFADDLVELYSQDESNPHFDLRTGGVRFFERDLDSVMADGGWSLLSKTEPDIWQHEEVDRYEIQSAWLRSGVSDQFLSMKI